MARPRKQPGRTPTRTRLLVAAEQAFAAQGFRGARLEDIAAAAGIRAPSLLYHFDSKETLYQAVVDDLFAAVRAAFAEAMARPDEPFEDRLVALLEGYVGFVEGRPAFASIVLRELVDGEGPARDVLAAGIDPLLRFVEGWLAQAGAGAVRPGVPLRAALVQLAANVLLRCAAGDLQPLLWPHGDTTVAAARRLLLASPQP